MANPLRAGAIGLACLLLLSAFAGAEQRSLDADVLDELNLARTQPQAYAHALEEAATYRWRASGAYDDPGAFEEAIAFLERQRALPPLGPDPALEGAALAHARYQGDQGAFGHDGPGGETLGERLRRHGAFASLMAEDISYGYANAREVVLQLIVDSGVPGRGHRGNLFNPAFREAGVACAPHRLYGAMCVVDFTGTLMRR
ncbi:MAG: CAP domain-containing protein [Caulobacteraceae bacterium]